MVVRNVIVKRKKKLLQFPGLTFKVGFDLSERQRRKKTFFLRYCNAFSLKCLQIERRIIFTWFWGAFAIETRELISIKIHETLAHHIGGETLTLFLYSDRKVLSFQHFMAGDNSAFILSLIQCLPAPNNTITRTICFIFCFYFFLEEMHFNYFPLNLLRIVS